MLRSIVMGAADIPSVESVIAVEPPDLSSTMTATITVSSAPAGYDLKIYTRADGGSWIDRTSGSTPTPALEDAVDGQAYSVPTDHTRDDSAPINAVTYEVKAEIVVGARIVDSKISNTAIWNAQ